MPGEDSESNAPKPLIRELVGRVWVDSGKLIIVDPTYIDQIDEDAVNEQVTAKARCQLINEGLAVAFHTGLRTAQYAVYVTRFENGALAKVEIDLAEGIV